MFEWNQESGLAIDNDFFDSANGTGNHRGFARHCLKIDNAERFVNGRANKHRCVRVKFAGRRLIHHFIDPDDSRPLRFCGFHCGFHFFRHLGRVRRGSTKDDLETAIHELDCAQQVLESFLACDPTDEQQIRCVWIDAVVLESIG